MADKPTNEYNEVKNNETGLRNEKSKFDAPITPRTNPPRIKNPIEILSKIFDGLFFAMFYHIK